MYNYRLKKIKFNNDTELELGNLTVIIGANNVGKSRALADIVNLATGESSNTPIVVNSVEWVTPESYEVLMTSYRHIEPEFSAGSVKVRSLSPGLEKQNSGSYGFNQDDYKKQLLSAGGRSQLFARTVGGALIAHLQTEQRLLAVKEGNNARDVYFTETLLQVLYGAGSAATKKVSEVVKKTFGVEVALDFTVPQKLKLRVGVDLDSLPQDPRDAAQLMKKIPLLDEQGDGLRSFVGMVVALSVSKRPVCLIDEPEAFLHPPHAFAIGQYIGALAGANLQIIISTHSADVLRGILSVSSDAKIIRIDRKEKQNTFHCLPNERLREISTDPLLASARVFDGLFYPAAVVVEADADARFYQIVSNRLRPNIDIHFVNADNKQTVPRITRLYEELGVKTVGIVDFDVLNNAAEFRKQVESLMLSTDMVQRALKFQQLIANFVDQVPASDRLGMSIAALKECLADLSGVSTKVGITPDEAAAVDGKIKRAESRCRVAFEAGKPWNKFKRSGKAELSGEALQAFNAVYILCADGGLLINPCGELESMLADSGLDYTSDKRGWIRTAIPIVNRLQIATAEQPWAFMMDVHASLFAEGTESV